ncbi:MAG: hypothetical protein IKZ98_11025 [Clostridia bacterium]|nr:hypothetical protein [Clostridia bacterium]
MKKSIALVLALILVLSTAAVAFAACSHTWYHADTQYKYKVKKTIAKPSGCIHLSNPHTHWRYEDHKIEIYVCSKGCGAVKKVDTVIKTYPEQCPKH